MLPPTMPSRSPHRNSFTGSPLRHSGVTAVDDEPVTEGIVGDNGYPHMGKPKRKSAGSDEHASAMPVAHTVGGSRYPAHMAGSNENSDDSTWRLSQGMPGGWQRSHSPGQRYSGDSNRIGSPVSPVESSGWNQRESMMSGSTAVDGTGKRLRLADLRKEEEDRARMEGRARMSSEWAGNGGYDGYQHHHHGVGQAM